MDAIRLYSAQLPDRVKKVVQTLVKGSDDDVKDILPIELGRIERISKECLSLAQSVEEKFEHVMDLTGELLEASSSARGYYQKKQEEMKLKREIALAKEKSAREDVNATKEQQERMEKEVREAKGSYERAVESMPGGWTILGLHLVETIGGMIETFGGMFGVKKECATQTAGPEQQEAGVAQRTSTKGRPVLTLKRAEELKSKTIELLEVLSSASKQASDDTALKAKEPVDKELQGMKVAFQELQKDWARREDGSVDPKIQELLEQGVQISEEGERIAGGLAFAPHLFQGVAKDAAELLQKVRMFCTTARAQTGFEAFTTKPPILAQTMSRSAGSASKGPTQTVVENARFKIAESRGILQRQEERYDQICTDLKEDNDKLSQVLENLAELSPEKLADFDQIRETLMQGIRALLKCANSGRNWSSSSSTSPTSSACAKTKA